MTSPNPQRAFVCLLGLPFRLSGFTGFLAGTMLLALIVWERLLRQPFRSHALQPLVLPVVGALWVAAQAVPLLFVPPGSSARLMAWAGMALCAAFTVMIVGMANAAYGWNQGKNRLVRVLAMLLSIGVLAVPSLAMHTAASAVGFTLSP